MKDNDNESFMKNVNIFEAQLLKFSSRAQWATSQRIVTEVTRLKESVVQILRKAL